MQQKAIFGIDVSKDTLDFYDGVKNENGIIINESKTINLFLQENIKKYRKPNLIFFFEPTGTYTHHLIKTLNDLQIKYYLLGLDLIANLGSALGDRNKTDEMDARKIANTGKMILEYDFDISFSYKKRIINETSNNLLEAKAVLSHMKSMKKQMKKYKQYIHNLKTEPFELGYIKECYDDNIKHLEDNIKLCYKKIEKNIEKEGYKSNLENVRTIPGISETTSIILSIFFIDLIQKGVKRKEKNIIRAYSGLDPQKKQSGSYIDKTKISKKGNPLVRSILYMASMTFYRYHHLDKYKETTIGQFTKRMIEKFIKDKNGKKVGGKTVLVALSGKLLVTSWAIFYDNQPYNSSK